MTDLKATIQLIKDNIDLRNIVPGVKKIGNMYMTNCFLHADKTPSMAVNEKYLYCFSCSAHMDVIGYMQHTQNVDFTTALSLAAIEAGISLDDGLYERMAVVQKERDERSEALWKYKEAYKSSDKAQQYLKDERGLTDETIEYFQLAYRPDYDAIVIPLISRSGNLVALSYRFLSNSQQRYMHKNTSEWQKGHELYNSKCLDFNDGPVYCCEGNFDVMALHQAGYKKCVGIMSGSLTDANVKELTGQSLIFVPDRKSDGDFDLFKRSVFRLRQSHPDISIKVALLPEGDPNSVSQEDLHEAISNCKVAEYAILQHDLDKCEEVETEYKVARNICKDVRDVLVLDDIIRWLAKRWSKSVDVVKQALDRSDNATVKVLTIEDGIRELEEIERRAAIDGLDMGWDCLKRLMPRIHTKQICLFAARANVGKTLWALNLLHKGRSHGIPTLFASFEQPVGELIYRLAVMTASEMDILSQKELHNMIVNGGENWDAVKAVLSFAYPHVRFIDKALDCNGFSDAIIDASYSFGESVRICYMDYMGLMRSHIKANDYERMSEIGRGVQEVTRERDVYGIYLSQLSRAAGDGTQRVTMDNLRGSGVLEEVGDGIIGAWRDQDSSEEDDDIPVKKIYIEVLKNRHGKRGSGELWLNTESLVISEADYYHGEQ